ncbi:MAG: Gfo/Idh/MocA family oxidoreductase, partial [Pseudomonadota bacterium]
MNGPHKPRLRFFESSPAQQHIAEHDRYLFAPGPQTHRVNVIGIGTIGQEHIRVAELLGRFAVHGVYDSQGLSVDNLLAHMPAKQRGELVRYASLEDACLDPDVDGLMICTPNYTHYDLLKTAVRSEKPIFLEKPMATTVEDAAAILALSNDYPAFIQIGLQYRYKAPYVEARHEILERRSIGDVAMLSMSEYRPPFMDKVGQWNKFAEFSGGTLVEKCCHYFDLLNLFAGSRPARVFASTGQAQMFTEFEYDGKRSDIDDHAFVIIDYRNGIRAAFALNMFSPQFHEELIVSGSDGRLIATERFDFFRNKTATATVRIERGATGATRDVD